MQTLHLFVVLITLATSVFARRRRNPRVDNGLCDSNQYRCMNEKCIKRSWFCDNANDCGDNSDEAYCNRHFGHLGNCPSHYPFFMCRNEYRCIPRIWSCDGVIDCDDESDETDCFNDVEQIAGSVSARVKAASWMRFHQTDPFRKSRRGTNAPRIAVSLYLADLEYFNEYNATGNELAAEIEIQLLVRLLRDVEEPLTTSELASYIHALLVTCTDPKNFYGVDLIKKLRQLVEGQAVYSKPYVLLVLCNAKDNMTQNDVEKLVYAFNNEENFLWKGTQALALMALSCIRELPHGPQVNGTLIFAMSLSLKKHQHSNGSFDNLQTTALVMQSLFASGEEDDHWDFDEAVKYIVKSQAVDGSFGNLLNTYFVLPVLYYKSLLNVSSSHCITQNIDGNEPNILDEFNYKIGKKKSVKLSLWFGDKIDMVRSLEIRVLENKTFFDVMNIASSLDKQYTFKYNILNSKPYIYALAGYQDDPENEKFWFLHKLNSSIVATDFIKSSTVDVIPKDKDEYAMWYHTGHWTKDLRMLLLDEETDDKKHMTTTVQPE